MIVERNERNRQHTLELFFAYPLCTCGKKECKHKRLNSLFDISKINFNEIHSLKYMDYIDKWQQNKNLN